MPERSSKKKDINENAFSIVQQATEQAPGLVVAVESEKNQAAVALGRLGGLKGGKARANSLSKEERSEIACRAAKARWSKRSDLQ